jgi:hypothetical protein
MANATDAFEDILLNQWFRGTAPAGGIPSILYFTLLKASPGESGSLAQEVSGGSYARVALTSNTTNWSAPSTAGSARRISNAVAITFPSPTADWGTVTDWAIMGVATLGTGTMYVYGALGNSRTILNGDNPPSFAIGAITIDFS